MTARTMYNETELQTRLRRTKEALAHAVEQENEARRALRMAEESRHAVKEKYEALFIEEEMAEAKRRNDAYTHCTK